MTTVVDEAMPIKHPFVSAFSEPSKMAISRWERWFKSTATLDTPEADERLTSYTERLVMQFEQSFFQAAESSVKQKKSFDREVAKAADSMLIPLVSMIGWGLNAHLILLDAAGRDASLPPRVSMTHAVVVARALAATNEIEFLLRHGLRHVALARWRLLYELAVFSCVLVRGNRYTCSRYLNHEYVLLMRASKSIYETDSERRARLAVRRAGRKFIKRYGSNFEGTYGWAARLTEQKLGVTRPNFGHLESLAPEVSELGRYRWLANHSTHADALGATLLREESGDLHIGPSLHRVSWIAAVTIDALRIVLEKCSELLLRHGLSRPSLAYSTKWLSSELGLTYKIEALHGGI